MDIRYHIYAVSIITTTWKAGPLLTPRVKVCLTSTEFGYFFYREIHRAAPCLYSTSMIQVEYRAVTVELNITRQDLASNLYIKP